MGKLTCHLDNFVCYPNRDSTPYKERYNIPEAETIVRGTLRYGGFPEFIKTLVDIGFLSDESADYLDATKAASPPTWAETTAKVVGATGPSENDIIWAIASKTQFPRSVHIFFIRKSRPSTDLHTAPRRRRKF